MSSAEDWIQWARRKAEAANGHAAAQGQRAASAARPGKQPPEGDGAYGIRQGNAERAAAPDPPGVPAGYEPFPKRQGNSEHAAAFGESQGNAECWGPGADEADPRRPGDPPWRGRTARRTSTPAAMAALRDARLRRGWSISRAAEETGISRPHLSLLERGLRRPSESVAQDIIDGYRMTPFEAGALSEIAVAWAGRDSPFRTGVEPGDW
jgi:Helix-turn-helix